MRINEVEKENTFGVTNRENMIEKQVFTENLSCSGQLGASIFPNLVRPNLGRTSDEESL